MVRLAADPRFSGFVRILDQRKPVTDQRSVSWRRQNLLCAKRVGLVPGLLIHTLRPLFSAVHSIDVGFTCDRLFCYLVVASGMLLDRNLPPQ
jgi:hypothetical protein